MHKPRTCIDKFPPQRSSRPYTRGDDARINEFNQKSAPRGNELSAEWDKRWRPGSTLRIRFLDGPPALHDTVRAFANQWLGFINLRFEFGNFEDAHIRITFQGTGYWSYIGTDALLIEADEPTMCFQGWAGSVPVPELEIQGTVLHEFGHALGCVHEHSSPEAGIPWNVEEVFRYYRTVHGWDTQQTYEQVLRKYDRSQVRSTEWDRDSIMQYAVDNALTLGDFEIPWNSGLSDQDKAFIASMYPR